MVDFRDILVFVDPAAPAPVHAAALVLGSRQQFGDV